jgi:hypothetical protein
MVKVLAEEAALLLGVPFVDHATAVRLLTEGKGEQRRVAGVLAIVKGARQEDNPGGCA